MDVVKVALFAVLSAVLVCLVRQTKSDFAVAVAVVSGVSNINNSSMVT